MGILASAIALLCLFVVWSIILCVLCGMGPRRVGFWSGRMVRPAKPSTVGESVQEGEEAPMEEKAEAPKEEKTEAQKGLDKEEKEPSDEAAEQHLSDTEPSGLFNEASKMKAMDETEEPLEGEPAEESPLLKWEKACEKQDRRLLIARITVLICGLGVIICVILMCVKGVGGLVKTMDSAIDGLEKAEGLSNEAIGIIDNFTASQQDVTEAIKAFEESWDTTCPNAVEIIDEEFDTPELQEVADVIEKV